MKCVPLRRIASVLIMLLPKERVVVSRLLSWSDRGGNRLGDREREQGEIVDGRNETGTSGDDK